MRLSESLSRVYDRQQKQAHLHAATEAIRPPKVVKKKKHAAHSMGDGGDRPLYVSVVGTGNAAENEQEKKKDRKRTRLCAVEW